MPTYKNYYKNPILIGTGIYKYRPYTILTPTVLLNLNLTGCSTSQTTMNRLGQTTINFVKETDYNWPTTVQVIGATLVSWNSGVLVVERATVDPVSITVACTKTAYTITETLSNVTAIGMHPTSIEKDATLELKYAPAVNYELPDTVAVAGATSDWNRPTGTLNVSNPTAAVTIKITGVALSKTLPEAPYTLKAAPSLTATHANFPFKTNFITGDSITVDATGITYNLEGNYGSTKVYDAATQTWAKAEYQSVTPTEDAKVSEAFYAWWEANIMSKLATPTGVQVADGEASWNEVENAAQYEIVVDNASWGTYVPAVYDYAFDESTGVLTLSDAPYEQNSDTVTIS